MGRRRTTIFKQLIFNVVIPAVIALLILGVLNYTQTRKILKNSNDTKNKIITDEIQHVLRFQDLALNILEDELDKLMSEYSHKLVYTYFQNTDNIEKADLFKIRKVLGMDPNMEDIYIINKEGKVVKSTFEQDIGLNFFSFGEEHKNMLLDVFKNGEYVSERFAIEDKTKRLKKYTYQPTLDGKFIVEIGFYSKKADDIIENIKNRLNNLSIKQESIMSVDLFIGTESLFSLNQDAVLPQEEISLIKEIVANKTPMDRIKQDGRKKLHYDYIYITRENTDLYKSAVIRIISDRSNEKEVFRSELIKFGFVFGLTLIAVVILIYQKTRVITDPIKKLVDNVNRITHGHLNERAEVIGNNEITKLSEHFNLMIEQLEELYNDLEQKVKERTAEVVAQKEEIEAQRDNIERQRDELEKINANLQVAYNKIEDQNKHITDSIQYASRIQNAILPPDDYVNKLLHDAFIMYYPKDIVSGDFYWMTQKDDKTMVAAVDCTGHGVPGAFMSIVGYNQLNYAVNVREEKTPAKILDAVNEGVTSVLHQKKTNDAVRDGMDIALCVIDKKKKILEYAGAFNPLYLIRDNELIIYKADKFPIGSFVGEKLNRFTNHSINIQKGDVIYIFSDGFADQFGGPDDRKFMSKRFRNKLLEIYQHPMDKQYKILEKTHLDWKGDKEQVDDILIIAIRVD